MIPTINDDLQNDFEIQEQPTKTYRVRFSESRISGNIEGRGAISQAIYKILNTERYDTLIYSWNYGVELKDLLGKPLPFAYPEIKRRITEALVQDERITSVENFVFTSKSKGKVLVRFLVRTTLGEVEAERMVDV